MRLSRSLVLSGITLMGFSSQLANANMCGIGTTVGEQIETVAGIQSYAENLDDIRSGLGIIPRQVISEKIRDVSKKAYDANELMSNAATICEIVSKETDPINKYFKSIDLLFKTSKLPMANWVSQQVKVGEAIVDNANKITTGVVSSIINNNAGAAIKLRIKVYDYGFVWDSSINAQKVMKGNYIKYVGFICQTPYSKKLNYIQAIPTFVNQYSEAIELGQGQDLLDSGCQLGKDKVFLNVVWNNYQRSIVPIQQGFYKAEALSANFEFVKQKNSYYLK